MVTPASRSLIPATARLMRQLSPGPGSEARQLRRDPSMPTPGFNLFLLPVGVGGPGARWTKPG